VTTARKKESFLKKRSKEEFVEELRKHFNSHVLEAYIFGSFNTDEFNADSDLDLLIVANTDIKFHERYILFPELDNFFQKEKIQFDLIIYTPHEFKKLTEEGKNSTVGFWTSFVRTSKKIQ
jgi:predicted nucleotidyltransferase